MNFIYFYIKKLSYSLWVFIENFITSMTPNKNHWVNSVTIWTPSFCLYQKTNNFTTFQTLPCLVRMCSKERLLEERVEGAETLAYLIEPDVELQRIASITDHLIAMLADYFKYPSSVSAITDIKRVCSLFLFSSSREGFLKGLLSILYFEPLDNTVQSPFK